MAELDCYRHGCTGTLCKATGESLLECDECHMELKKSSVERLTEQTGPIAQLAQHLCEMYE